VIEEDITQTLWKASDELKSCRILLTGEPLTRNINPYGICRTSQHEIVLVCWQSLGFTKPGRGAGFRNLKLGDIEEVEVLETRFERDPGFNPKDPQYKEWVYHI
jgi:hypothetical protein